MILRRLQSWYWDLDVSRKIQLALTALTALTISIVTVIFSNILHENILEERRTNAAMSLVLVEEKLATLFEGIETNTKIALTHTDVQQVLRKVVTRGERLNPEDISMVKSPLNSIVYPRSVIDALVINDFRGNIYTSGSIRGDLQVDEEILYNLEEEGSGIYWRSTRMSRYEIDNRRHPVLSVHRLIHDYNSGMAVAVLSATVREEELSEAYRPVQSDGTEVLLLDRSGKIISHSDKGMLFLSVRKAPYFSDLLGGSERGEYRIDGKRWYMHSRFLPRLECYLVGLIPDAALKGNSYTLMILCAAIGLTAIALAVLLSRGIARSIIRPLHQLSETMSDASTGDLEVRAPEGGSGEIGMLSREFNSMLARISDLMDRLQDERQQKTSFEFQARQQQINPHFLYNTLDAVSSLVYRGDSQEAVKTIGDLSNYYRLVLSSGKSIIRLEQEIDSVHYYLSIIKLRYGDKISWKIDLPESCRRVGIVKLTLQPLVENAFYHGLKEQRGPGHLVLYAEQREGLVFIHVEDNGVGMEQRKLDAILSGGDGRSGYGLSSVHERIQLYYGEDYGISGISSPGQGTRLRVAIPYQKVE